MTAHDSAEALHRRSFPDEVAPALWRLVPTRRSIVLGSRQVPSIVEAEVRDAGEFEIAKRNSGGGAVIVDPTATLWVDIFLPRAGSLWSADLGQTFLTVGALWQDALTSLGTTTQMWRQRPDQPTRDVGALACFADVGWGELLLAGRKIVGLSQRRTRWGARVQGLYDPTGQQRALVDALDLAGRDRATLASIFLPTVSELPPVGALWDALVASAETLGS